MLFHLLTTSTATLLSGSLAPLELMTLETLEAKIISGATTPICKGTVSYVFMTLHACEG